MSAGEHHYDLSLSLPYRVMPLLTPFPLCFIGLFILSPFRPLSVAYRGGLWGSTPPPSPKFRSFEKAVPNSQLRGIYLYIPNNLIGIWVSHLKIEWNP
jgi:hypothetical protein